MPFFEMASNVVIVRIPNTETSRLPALRKGDRGRLEQHRGSLGIEVLKTSVEKNRFLKLRP